MDPQFCVFTVEAKRYGFYKICLMEEFEIWELIIKYLSNETDDEEDRRLFAWINANGDNYQFYQEAKTLWDEGHLTFSGQEKDQAFVGLRQKLDRESIVAQTKVRKRPNVVVRDRSRPYWRQIAASILILAVLTTAGFLVLPLTSSPDGGPVSYVEKHTPKGKKLKTTLPDGTKVWLNANSQLRFPGSFSSTERTVFLSGEAYFEVAHDATRPFTVKSDVIHTTALGTSFNIRAFPAQSHIDVTLLTGKVKVAYADSNKPIQEIAILEPNDQVVYDKKWKNAIKNTLHDAANHIAWKEGIIILKDMNFEQIARELERWYDITVTFENDNLKNCQLEGKFKQVSLQKVLKMLSMTANFTYEIADDQVYIKGAGCNYN